MTRSEVQHCNDQIIRMIEDRSDITEVRVTRVITECYPPYQSKTETKLFRSSGGFNRLGIRPVFRFAFTRTIGYAQGTIDSFFAWLNCSGCVQDSFHDWDTDQHISFEAYVTERKDAEA